MKRVAYLIPEFPGQTHTWIWRELAALRGWGADIRLVSTRPPPPRDRARHAFAAAADETFYLFRPRAPLEVAGGLLGVGLRRPATVLAAAQRALGLPIDGGRQGRRLLPLLGPAARLRHWCVGNAIEHVHCHTCAQGAVVAMLAETMGGPPYSLCINANLEWWGGAMAEKIAGAAFSYSTMRWVRDQARAQLPPQAGDKVEYAPVGVDTVEWRPLLPAVESADAAPLALTCVGRLHASKGFDVAIEAMALLQQRGVALHLTILGDGPERPVLEALVDRLGLAGRISLPGSVAEAVVRARMGASDIFLLPSHAEPLGVVVMEAMAMAVPVIATAAGGVGEIVTDGIDGVLVRPGDPRALADAIAALAADPERRRRLAAAGRCSVVERFDARVGARRVWRWLYGTDPPR